MIQTVSGPIQSRALKVCLPHEHILIEPRSLVTAPPDEKRRALFNQKLTLETVGYTMNDPYALLDNAVLDDEQVAVRELTAYREAGGVSLVDVTLRDIGRNPLALARLAQATGVQIIAGCGYYIAPSHPKDMDQRSVEDIAGEMVGDLTQGMDGTDKEWKALRAAALAHRQTGAGIHVHTSLWERNGLAVVNLLTDMGIPADKICIDHIDVDLRYDYITALCRTGAMVEFDNFGKEYYIPSRLRHYMKGRFAYDLERVEMIRRLADDGWIDHLLITNDICLKSLLHSYGGRGYDHILTNIVPMMEDVRLTDAQVETLLIKNPARLLDL